MVSNKSAVISKDDVARLVRGRPSKSRAGSRNIRHRLRQDELERLAVARSRGYLLLTQSTRAALRNSWYMDCKARGVECLYVERMQEGFLVTRLEEDRSSSKVVADIAELSSGF